MNLAITFQSKLPKVGTTIFSVMSKLANDFGAINLSQGFPNFDPPTPLVALATKYMQSGYHQYAPMRGLPQLREQLAAKNEWLYGATIDPATEIVITAGASQAIFSAIQAFVHQRDEVIIIEPAFDIYQPAVELQGGVVVPYQLPLPDRTINWSAFAQLLTPKTKVILLNTPHNPTGATLKEEDWQALSKIVENTNIVILSDEVYEHIVFDGQPHCSVLRYPELWQRSFAVFSFGKTFHATGWKMGYITGPAYLMAEVVKNHQFSIFCVNPFIQHAIATFLDNRAYLEGIAPFFQHKRDLFNEALAESRFELLPTEGSYFQLAKYDRISDEADTSFAIRITKEYGVATIPTSVFYADQRQENLIRFCFGKTDETLLNAAERLCKI